jgi:hypothetical protein
MDRDVAILLVVFAAIGMLATLMILRRDRLEARAASTESQFAVSTEGEKRCPKCGLGNLVTSGTCAGCGTQLAG